jgi:6-phosphogluconolactonase
VYPGRMRTLVLALLTSALWMPNAQSAKKPSDYFVYIGTYTGPASKGIYAYRFHPADGKLTPIGLAAETTNPSFLAIHPNGRFVYSVSELDNYNGQKTGAVSAFSIDPQSGKLTLLNTVSSRGGGPCHVLVDKTGKNLLVANYGTGSVASLPVKDDGSLGEASAFVQHTGQVALPERQGGPHAHSVNLSADNRFMIATDLGLDEALVYRFDAAKGTLTPNDPPFAKVEPGSGPRHFAFTPRVSTRTRSMKSSPRSPRSGTIALAGRCKSCKRFRVCPRTFRVTIRRPKSRWIGGASSSMAPIAAITASLCLPSTLTRAL